MSSCMQYYYDNKEDSDKNKIQCKEKIFPDFKDPLVFNNDDFLKFIDNEYGNSAFPHAEKSPFEFSDSYINETHLDICNSAEFKLTPQQKFCGQFVNPNTNFMSALIYHGLGSGKTCTSLIIGEAFKDPSSSIRLLYVVPAPLIDQYFDEIIGRLEGDKLFSCTSQCVFKSGGESRRDFYTNVDERKNLDSMEKRIKRDRSTLFEIESELDSSLGDIELTRKYSKLENKIKILKQQIDATKQQIKAEAVKVFEIVSQPTFMNELYQVDKDGKYVKKKRLIQTQDNPLFNRNSILIIDEVQRLVSAGGVYYKKLYNAIKYYFHPELRIILLSATPIYDNPFELALTINLLRPRVPFPTKKEDFYKFFIGDYDEKSGKCIPSEKPWIQENSCIINHDIIRYICSGYVSYFKGGNPVAYPYKRVITIEHIMRPFQKREYISALKSDISKDRNFNKETDTLFSDEIIFGNYESEKDDKVSGIYVKTQQYSNIALPVPDSLSVTTFSSEIRASLIKNFEKKLIGEKFQTENAVVEYIRSKEYSDKFAKIIELSLRCNGPVFIFSNWLQFGVESLGIILDACGYVKFPKQGEKRYFIWSSETKKKDASNELISRARKTFNSRENKDGSLLKIILGTRSVMEGVSFKNVREVHITDPWWNEARIEQILARAVRFCSHTDLNENERHVDIYRHYSVLPDKNKPDSEIVEMLREMGREKYKNFEYISIDQKMSIASIKKLNINSELEEILKSVAVDCILNKNGNLIRLEELIKPLNSGKYQPYFRNPSTGQNYLRDGIPLDGITWEQLYNRVYSFPNADLLPVMFREADFDETGDLLVPIGDVLGEPDINKDLVLNEDIKCWRSSKTLSNIDGEKELKIYISEIYPKYFLIPELRAKYLGERGNDNRRFIDSPAELRKLIECIKKLSESKSVSDKVGKEIMKKFNSDKIKKKVQKKIIKLIYEYKLFDESYIENLYELAIANPNAIDELIKDYKTNLK